VEGGGKRFGAGAEDGASDGESTLATTKKKMGITTAAIIPAMIAIKA
jgi:hypothetical protein